MAEAAAGGTVHSMIFDTAASEYWPLVLVVDDDDAVRNALKFSLELEGFRVEIYGSSEDLLEGDLPAQSACLVMDQHLPGLNGMDALKQLRLREVRLPALLITSHPRRSLRTAAAAAGVAIVEKPLMGNALVLGIRAALRAGEC